MDDRMIEKLRALETRYDDLGVRMGDPSLTSDQGEFQKTAKEHARLQPVVTAFQEYMKVLAELDDARVMAQDKSLDAEMRELAQAELEELQTREKRLAEELQIALLPRDPNDEKNVVVEIRAGTGGDEASLFAADLFRMYTRYAERQGWRYQVMDSSESEVGGFKEIIFTIEAAEGVYSRMKYEAGVHRVQRVPVTEAQGRIHTSTATVVVMPEVEELELNIPAGDIKIEVQRASGAGGQHVNKTESAVRMTHLPTGIVVYCADDRSQIKNRASAMRVLMARVFDHYNSIAQAELEGTRRSMVGNAERAEKIRTYNFPQDRMTDHRIGLTVHNLPGLLEGAIGDVIDALVSHDQAEKLRALEE